MVNIIFCLVLALAINKSDSQILTVTPSCIATGQSVTLRCETTDFTSAILFYLNGNNKGGCTGGICATGIVGYNTPTQSGTFTEMEIEVYDHSRDGGDWTCNYGGTPSSAYTVELGNNCVATTEASTEGTPSSGGLSAGIIVGISFAAVCGVCVVTAIAIFAWKKRQVQLPDQNSALEAKIGSQVELLNELCKSKPIRSIQWFFNDKPVKTGEGFNYIGGDTNRPSLTISRVSNDDFGMWKCILETKSSKRNFFVQLIYSKIS